MMECMLDNDQRNFWQESKKIHKETKLVPPCVDNAETPQDIAEMFANKYAPLYNSVSSKSERIQRIRAKLNADIMADVDNTDHIVHSSEVQKAAQTLMAKKPDGEKALWSNHIQFGPHELFDQISKLLNAMLVHGTTPYDLLTSTINSIPKNKLGDMSDSNNYRGTALISAIERYMILFLYNGIK